jgi:3-phenylpropionate/trans-cinnamate dioxygenase ferredoxin reductase component
MTVQPMVIVGGGLAGATAAGTLRKEGYAGPVILIGQEQHLPYLRPPLSKEYLNGKQDAEATLVHDGGWYRSRNIDLRLGETVSEIDPARRSVTLAGGDSLEYDRLLLATGASPRTLRIPGADLQGVHYLRTLQDSTRLRDELAGGGRRVVIIGSGWIGMETAAAARTYGNQVTVLGRDTIPLRKAIGDELGGLFAEVHEEHGVEFRHSASPARFLADAPGSRITAVVTDGGETLPADLVIAAVGVSPNTELAEAAGLAVSNGIDVDASLRTSDPHIHAAGDVANAFHPVLNARLRSEHWANAVAGGKAAARAMLGQPVSFDDIPYFYTDQYDLGMEYSGYFPLAADADVVLRGDLDRREFIAFWVRDGKVIAGMNVNVWDVQEPIKDLIRSGRTVDSEALADTTRELKSL